MPLRPATEQQRAADALARLRKQFTPLAWSRAVIDEVVRMEREGQVRSSPSAVLVVETAPPDGHDHV